MSQRHRLIFYFFYLYVNGMAKVRCPACGLLRLQEKVNDSIVIQIKKIKMLNSAPRHYLRRKIVIYHWS
jgi:hypothetical protein